MKLLLFDIDGTLLMSGGAGRTALNRALYQLFGHQDGFANVPMMGRTDPLILKDVFFTLGLQADAARIAHFQEIYYRFLDEELKNNSVPKSLCPGIPDLLKAIDEDPDLTPGILTGNWEKGAFLKLKAFNIHNHFHLGAYADDAAERVKLVPFAMKRFRIKYGYSINPGDVYVIGDTPLDIIAAKPHGVRTVGVATGHHTLDEIAEENPDLLLENLEDYPVFLEALKSKSH